MTNASMVFIATLATMLQCSCATPGASHYWQSPNGLTERQIEAVLRDHPVLPTENIVVTPLARVESASHHLVQVRHSELLHIHRDHDLTVFVYRGRGRMRIGDRTFAVRAGDVLLIPRGVPHAFENTAHSPAVAVVVFTPAFDGKHTAPVGQ